MSITEGCAEAPRCKESWHQETDRGDMCIKPGNYTMTAHLLTVKTPTPPPLYIKYSPYSIIYQNRMGIGNTRDYGTSSWPLL